MALYKCPGQDRRFWKTGDIFEVACPHCASPIEFWKDDPQRKCGKCGGDVMNPKVRLGCAEWCQYAKECLGLDADTDADAPASCAASLCDGLIDEMKGVFGDDDRRIRHALAVLDYAQQLLEAEGGDPLVVKAAALLHDIGIQEAERKHGSCAGKYQEMEGPAIARQILEKHNVPHEQIDHVCRIVGSHHSANDIDTLEFQIIWDADWLVNLADEAEGRGEEEVKKLARKVFRTETGKRMGAGKFLG